MFLKRTIPCFGLCAFSLFLYCSELFGAVSARITPVEKSRTYYTATAGDLDGDGRDEIIGGAFDDSLVVTSAEGEILWTVALQGLPYSIALGDADGDGKKEIAVAVMDRQGSLKLLAYRKGLVWSYRGDLPFLSVAMGDVDGDGHAEVISGSFLGEVFVFDRKGKLLWKRQFGERNLVSTVACGDLDGRKGDEILIGTSLKGVFALDGKGGKLWHLKAKDVFVDPGRTKRKGMKHKKRVSHNKLENVQTIQVVDLDNDGRNEVVVGARPHGLVLVLDADGKKRWQSSTERHMDITAAAWAAAGDFLPKQQGLEVFAIVKGTGVSGHRGEGAAVVLDSSGSEQYLALPKTQFFSAAAMDISRGASSDDVILSSAARGRGMSRVAFSEGGVDQLKGYCDDIELKIRNGLPKVEKGAKAASRTGIDKPFHFLFRVDYRDIYKRDRRFLESFLRPVWNAPGDNAIVITGLKENVKNILRGDWKRGKRLDTAQIVEIARWLEKQKVPFYLNVGKHVMLFFRVETLEDVMRVAGNTCRGFVIDEDNYSRVTHWDKLLRELDNLLARMKAHGNKKLVMNEYRGFWHRGLLENRFFDTLFKPEYRGLVVPIYKPNNIKAPELNMGTLVGLWRHGFVKEWGVGVYADIWKWGTVFVGAPADIHLRLAMMSMSLGGNYVVVAKNLTWNKGYVDFAPQFSPYFHTLFDLIRTGVIEPVQNPKDLYVNKVSLWEAGSTREIAMREQGTQVYWQKIFRLRGWNDTGFFLQATRDGYLSAQFYRSPHYYDMLFPVNPYGFVTLMPYVNATSKMAKGVYWLVNGEALYRCNKDKREKSQSSGPIREAVISEASSVPFTATGVFCSVVRVSHGYLIYLVNPLVFEALDVRTSVTANNLGGKWTMVDAISGARIPCENGRCNLTVPAGLFRILKVMVS